MKSSSLFSGFTKTLLVVGGLLVAGSAAQAQQNGEVVSLRAESHRGQCLTVSLSKGGSVTDCSASPLQKIALSRAGAGWELKVGGRCLRAGRGSEPVVAAGCGGPDTRWTFNNHGQIKSESGRCLHVWLGSGDRGKVTTNNCTGQANQKWARYKPIPAEGVPETARNAMITPKSAPGKCLDVESRFGQLITWDCHGQANQRLSFTWGEQTQIRVKNGCLVPDNGHARKSNVTLQRCEQSKKTKIWIAGNDGRIRNVYGACLEVNGSGLKNGTEVMTNTCSNNVNQRFYVRR